MLIAAGLPRPPSPGAGACAGGAGAPRPRRAAPSLVRNAQQMVQKPDHPARKRQAGITDFADYFHKMMNRTNVENSQKLP